MARFFRVRPRVMTSRRALGTPAADAGDERLHAGAAVGSVGFAVGGDHALVDAPGRLDLHVVLDVEQQGQALALAVGEQVGAGVQGPSGPVERIAGAPAVSLSSYLCK